MADAAMADAAAPPPAAVTYATLPYNGTTLVVEARWHEDASVDVQLTDGAAVWHKAGARGESMLQPLRARRRGG